MYNKIRTFPSILTRDLMNIFEFELSHKTDVFFCILEHICVVSISTGSNVTSSSHRKVLEEVAKLGDIHFSFEAGSKCSPLCQNVNGMFTENARNRVTFYLNRMNLECVQAFQLIS